MNSLEKQLRDYNYFSKIIQKYKYIEIYVEDLYCCTYYYKKIFFEIEPSLILIRDYSDGIDSLLINKDYFIEAINEMYNTIYENDSLSIISKIYRIYSYRMEAEKSLSQLPSINIITNAINEYYLELNNDITHT
jgi:hypothetical protein